MEMVIIDWAKFFCKIKFRMSVGLFRMSCAEFGHIWCDPGLATIYVDTRQITYDSVLDINTYFALAPISN